MRLRSEKKEWKCLLIWRETSQRHRSDEDSLADDDVFFSEQIESTVNLNRSDEDSLAEQIESTVNLNRSDEDSLADDDVFFSEQIESTVNLNRSDEDSLATKEWHLNHCASMDHQK
ncbi:hypothetical protein OIU74_015996 [Salix koriyanagi]|uniref:Uncharacterized protein n=1 Tax=Salix koriyanagi TaxID=2511006 RepID=A0A9Q0PN72_9ROSI|nr:hypothetical protein OIU74_015996 [Salix koriyanagi]